MNCIGPLTPEDFELLAYADGEASPGLQAHLSACSYCQNRTEELRREQLAWQTALHRAGCPRPLELGEHHLGLLSADRTAALAAHLALCRECRAETETLRQFLTRVQGFPGLEAIEDAGTRLRTIVGRLSSLGAGTGSGMFSPAPRAAPALRGLGSPNGLSGSPQSPLAYDAEDYLVTVEFWPEGPGRQTRQVVGLVVGPGDLAGAEVEVEGATGGMQATKIDEAGNFSLSGVAVGAYRMLVKLPAAGVQVRIDDLAVS